MGRRTLNGFYNKYSPTVWTKNIPDIESPIYQIFINSVLQTEVKGVLWSALADNEWTFDYLTFEFNIKLPSGIDPNDENVEMKTFFYVVGRWDSLANCANNMLNQVFKPTVNVFLKYVRMPIFFYSTGAVGITDLKLEIHPVDSSDIPREKVLATSINNLMTSLNINSKPNTLFDVYFEFNDFGLKANEKYALVFKPSSSTPFSDNFHISWVRLEPVYTAGLTIDRKLVTEGPLRYSIIGRKQ
jgi:hypothetical protein